MLGRIFTVGGYTLLSRLTGFARDIMLAAILGAGPVADAFFVALRLPNHFRAIFAEGAFNAAFVPAYAHVHGKSGEPRRGCSPTASSRCCLPSQLILLVVAWVFMPEVIAHSRARVQGRSGARRTGDLADADHVSVSAADHAGDALRRHAQRDASLRQRRRRADLSQSVDDGDAGAGRVLSGRGLRRRLGRPDCRHPRIPAAGRRCGQGAASCRSSRHSGSTRTSARSFARSGLRPSARWERRSRCSPTPSSRPFCRPARFRRCITPTASTSCRSA